MKKNPSIRFNGFTDTWEQRNILELGKVFIGLVTTMTSNYREQGTLLIRNSDIKANRFEFSENPIHLETSFAEKNSSRKLLIGDVVTVHTGDIGTSAVITEKENGAIGFATINTRPNTEMVIPDFLSTYFNTNAHKNYALKMSTGDGRSNYNLKDFNKVMIPLPNIEEQQKIGGFFKSLDNTIALHQRQLDNYKALKKVMLQKIFDQELRFKDQEGNNYPDWEKIALNELGETYTGLSGKTKENFGKGKERFVTYMNVYSNPIADLAMTENVEIKDGENQNEVCYGDIFFTTSSETPEEVGMSSVWLSHESKVYLNSFCFGYRLSSRSEGVISPDFLGFQLRAPHIRKKIIFLAQGSTRFNISKSKVMDIVVYMPTIEEQNKITAFLLNVDSRIKHTIQSIQRLNMLKKALLQQMFI